MRLYDTNTLNDFLYDLWSDCENAILIFRDGNFYVIWGLNHRRTLDELVAENNGEWGFVYNAERDEVDELTLDTPNLDELSDEEFNFYEI